MPGVSTAVAAVLLAAVLAAFAWIGLRAWRSALSLDDYLTARGSQTATPLALSFLASGAGAWILFAPPEVGAFVGPLAVAGYAVGAGMPFLLYALVGPRLRRLAPRGHGLTSFLRARYGRAGTGCYNVLIAVRLLSEVFANLLVVGIIFGQEGTLAYNLAIGAIAVLTLAYSMAGGLRASLRTDVLQMVLLLGVLGAVYFVGAIGIFVGPIILALFKATVEVFSDYYDLA